MKILMYLIRFIGGIEIEKMERDLVKIWITRAYKLEMPLETRERTHVSIF